MLISWGFVLADNWEFFIFWLEVIVVFVQLNLVRFAVRLLSSVLKITSLAQMNNQTCLQMGQS